MTPSAVGQRRPRHPLAALVRRAFRVSKAICPGSFDPITLGHVDIIERAAKTCDEVIVAVAINDAKQPLFDREERVRMIREACAHLKNVSADSFRGLMVDYAEEQGARVVVKGLRAVSDFESELQMALMNRNLNVNVETLFVMTSAETAVGKDPTWAGLGPPPSARTHARRAPGSAASARSALSSARPRTGRRRGRTDRSTAAATLV